MLPARPAVPLALRAPPGAAERVGNDRLTIEVRPPFRMDLTVWALRRRPHNTVDAWDGTTYTRTLVSGGVALQVAVRREQDRGARLVVEVRPRGRRPNEAAIEEARGVVERMLGVHVDLSGFYELAAADDRLAALALRFRGMRPPRFPSVFEALVNAVACQQLSLDVGIHLLDRLAAAYGPRVALDDAGAGFPAAERLAAAAPEDLRRLGFSSAKAATLVELSQRVATGALELESLVEVDDAEATAALVALPGIGRWSAEYVLLRGLGRLEVLPGDDVGARNSLRRCFGLPSSAGYDEVAAMAERWRPYGGLVYFHLLLDGLARSGLLGEALDTPGLRVEGGRTGEPGAAPAGASEQTSRSGQTGRSGQAGREVA